MRVVSLVPSWTETLIEAGVEVVGRTRFCLHPHEKVHAIPAVGGTKDWDFNRIRALKPDLILLDREENPKFMAEQNEFPVVATHVYDMGSVAASIEQLALTFKNSELDRLVRRWKQIVEWSGLPRWHWEDDPPGLLEWGRKPQGPVTDVVYVIWRNPWMSVSRQTFIGSALEKCGFEFYLREFETKYPIFELRALDPANTLLLFSSEPYPFLRQRSMLKSVVHPHAFVDGECFSWFGVRALKFLESLRASD